MQSSLKRNLIIGFGISLVILIISSAASYISIRNLLKSSALVEHTNDVKENLNEIISEVKNAETGQRGYLITGLDEFLAPYNGASQRSQNLLNSFKELTVDNPAQQSNTYKLEELVEKRFSLLRKNIEAKKNGSQIDVSSMQEGKHYMDSLRLMVKLMNAEEDRLMKIRTGELNRFSSITPIMILAAAAIAIIITLIFYSRMLRDIVIRTKLQEELIKKDEAITQRIATIQSVSEKISAGDYSVRVKDIETDGLGNISESLNKMAYSLQSAFTSLSEKEWLQTGIAGLNETIIGENNLQNVLQKVMDFIAGYTNSQVGAVYLRSGKDELELKNGYALIAGNVKTKIRFGEGLVGQCAITRKQFLVLDLPEENFNINFTAAGISPVNIIVFPILFENDVKGVIELGSLHQYTRREQAFFAAINENIGIAINTVQSREKVQELLEETQSQAEELMSQQAELEQINYELEAQAQQLQTSEEELKVQSEELIETNTLLEEKSASLEERNRLIQQKNAEIEKKAADLALTTKYKSEFLANMSHELRTPLNSILLLSRLMAENNQKNLTDEQIQYANVIRSSGNGLLQLIDEILDLSKIESGKMTVEMLPVKVSEIAESMNALFAPLAREKQLNWSVVTDPAVPAEIETDRLRLEQILKNLLSNALKFTSEGYVQLSISCPDADRRSICFTVKDSGIGISEDKQPLVFEAFQQEDGSTRRKYGGTGLGLSISRELARLLGGEILLKSTPGKGSEFTCCIPVVYDQSGEDKKEKEHDRMSVTTSQLASAPTRVLTPYDTDIIPDEIPDDRNDISTEDKVILIIEDDINFATALLEYARKRNYKGIVAVRGDRGIEMALRFQPSGILLDVQLPVMNGLEVIEALKENPHTRHIPVHVLSSHQVKKESLLKGAVDFIEKPVAFDKLNTIFEKLEFILNKRENKVLIIEENNNHAQALAYYLRTYNVHTEIHQNLDDGISSLHKKDVDCVILDSSLMEGNADLLMETVRKNKGLEDLPIILFTGKSMTQPEEFKIKKYADAIVMKTANSYQRILDEVSLFLHLVQEQQKKKNTDAFEFAVMQENVLKDKKVLLADDDVRNIYSMTKALEKYQMKVIPAMDGAEAIRLINTDPVDVVLMDIMMPQMDGYESIRTIRKNPLFKNTPIIAVTAKAMSGDREKCIAAGASDYISKPVDMDQLISLLRIWLHEKR